MPKKKTAAKRRTAWAEGDAPPTTSIVQTMHVEGITYQRKFIACGKERCRKGCAEGRPSHGPYWYAMHWNPKTSKTKAVYVGKNEPSLTQITQHVTEED
jgi:hypothetical protein